MATKARKSARKSARAGMGKRGSASRAGARKSAAKKSSARKSSGRNSAAKRSAKRSSARNRASTRKRQSPVSRVKRVTREVVQQATSAVSAGMDSLRDLSETIVDRVRQD